MTVVCPSCRVPLIRVLSVVIPIDVIEDRGDNEYGEPDVRVAGQRPTRVERSGCPVCRRLFTTAIEKVGDVQPTAA